MSRGNVERRSWFIFGRVKYLCFHDQLSYKCDQAVIARGTKHYWSKHKSFTTAV